MKGIGDEGREEVRGEKRKVVKRSGEEGKGGKGERRGGGEGRRRRERKVRGRERRAEGRK